VRLGRRLPRSFSARSALEVAPDLLGRVLSRTLADGSRLAARIVETEAYEQGDPASHAFGGRTARNATMFGRPGHLYVYFTYGMHFCMNLVTGREGEGSAVLLRAAEPLVGLEVMTARRRTADVRALCSGPARWAEAFGVTREEDGADLVRGHDLGLHEGTPVTRREIARTTRVGVRRGAEREWRFIVRADPFVSPGRASRRGRPTGSR
jgi:DNA-3-methyladenine glycosylase